MTAPLSVAILGSCISRDSFNTRFNPSYKDTWSCVLIQNQSSIISIMSDPVELTDRDLGDISAYNKREVLSDTSKSFLQQVVELAPDYLIIDFFGDVHFGCVRLPDGRYLTDNRWKLRTTDYYRDLSHDGPLPRLRMIDGVDAYLEVWEPAFDRLIAFVREHLPRTRLVLHRGKNTDRLALPGRVKTKRLTGNRRLHPIDAEQLNTWWAIFDDYAATKAGIEQIDLTAHEYATFDGHPWGPFYVHYTLDYYADFLAALNTIALRAELDGPDLARSMAMIDQIARHSEPLIDAERERHAAQVARLRHRLRRQPDPRRRSTRLGAALARMARQRLTRGDIQ